MLAHPQVARADAPVPLGQAPTEQTRPVDDGGSAPPDPATSAEGSADDWSGGGWFDDASWDGAWWDGAWWDDDASWGDRVFRAPAEQAPPPDAAPPADKASPAEQAPSADATLAATAAVETDVLAAPTMSTSGTSVTWTPTTGVSSYVFARIVPGQPTQYSVVNGTSTTPPVVAGQTIRYGVRTNVSRSNWAEEVSITYPASTTVDPKTAPALTASSTTLRWNRIGSVSSYLLSRTWPDGTVQTSTVNGTSTTPASAPGKTLRYRVRTSVTGSAWSNQVSIAYPESSPPPPSPTPQPVDGAFQMGMVGGAAHTYEISFLKSLGAKTARLEFGINNSPSSMASVIDQYARAGIRPLLLASFYGRVPSSSEAQNLGSWAAAYGPGGTFWQGKSYPANTAVTKIEFGNETSFSYQFSDYSLGTYSSRAQAYAQRARDAANAIRSANARVGLLAIGDNAVNGTAWVTNLLRSVPTLDDLVAGWTVHPYGPNWASRLDSTINSARSAGARDLPIWITEWGLATDNGRCLDDNYGFDRCMTYAEAASTLHGALAGMKSRYGSRLGAFYLYQAHDQYASGVSTSRERYFGALQSNANAKGAYTTEVKGDLAAN